MSLQILAAVLGVVAVLAWYGRLGGNPFVSSMNARQLLILGARKAIQEAEELKAVKQADDLVEQFLKPAKPAETNDPKSTFGGSVPAP